MYTQYCFGTFCNFMHTCMYITVTLNTHSQHTTTCLLFKVSQVSSKSSQTACDDLHLRLLCLRQHLSSTQSKGRREDTSQCCSPPRTHPITMGRTQGHTHHNGPYSRTHPITMGCTQGHAPSQWAVLKDTPHTRTQQGSWVITSSTNLILQGLQIDVSKLHGISCHVFWIELTECTQQVENTSTNYIHVHKHA